MSQIIKPIKFYYDLMSQPSRALYIFLKLNPEIPIEEHTVALRKGEHFTDHFAQEINRFQRVPCINDGGFKLAESIAIFKYFTRKFRLAEHWYPNDIKIRARIDEYFEWQHFGLRTGCAMYFRKKLLGAKDNNGREYTEQELSKAKQLMIDSLDLFERIWLSENDGDRFLIGSNLTFVDLLAASEIEQTRMTSYDPCHGRPKLSKWLNLVRTTGGSHYEVAHKQVNRIVANVSKL